MATEYEVWLTARHPQTLGVVGSIRAYHHADRLTAERVLETATDHYSPVAHVLRLVQPGALVSSEMKHPQRVVK